MANFFRRNSPYRINNHGTGISATAMNPSKLFPQPSPSLAYIGSPASGKKAPRRERTTELAASAEAA